MLNREALHEIGQEGPGRLAAGRMMAHVEIRKNGKIVSREAVVVADDSGSCVFRLEDGDELRLRPGQPVRKGTFEYVLVDGDAAAGEPLGLSGSGLDPEETETGATHSDVPVSLSGGLQAAPGTHEPHAHLPRALPLAG